MTHLYDDVGAVLEDMRRLNEELAPEHGRISAKAFDQCVEALINEFASVTRMHALGFLGGHTEAARSARTDYQRPFYYLARGLWALSSAHKDQPNRREMVETARADVDKARVLLENP